MSKPAGPYRILFVCLGNICRSPAAQSIMNTLITTHKLNHLLMVDSAGTERYNIGMLSDVRMRSAGGRRNHIFDHRARQFQTSDFDAFDLILAMDKDNLREIRNLARSSEDEAKTALFLEHCQVCADAEVPDPYYGGAEGFEDVLDMLEEGCHNLVQQIIPRLKPVQG